MSVPNSAPSSMLSMSVKTCSSPNRKRISCEMSFALLLESARL